MTNKNYKINKYSNKCTYKTNMIKWTNTGNLNIPGSGKAVI